MHFDILHQTFHRPQDMEAFKILKQKYHYRFTLSFILFWRNHFGYFRRRRGLR